MSQTLTITAEQVLASAERIREDIVRDRRTLHAAPEVGTDLPNTVACVKKRLLEMGYQPRELAGGVVAEITGTETGRCLLLRADMDALRATFDRLRSIGIRIAMDDFGTGYSSLGLLAQSPADIVKIDRLFIKDIHREAFNRAFIDAVIELCHSVGIEVTVEGVEEPTELDAVRAIGADSIQGFFVSCPIPAHSFEERFITPQTAS